MGPECSEGYFSCSRRSERECIPETRTTAKSARTELEDNNYGLNYLKLNSRVKYFVKFTDIQSNLSPQQPTWGQINWPF